MRLPVNRLPLGRGLKQGRTDEQAEAFDDVLLGELLLRFLDRAIRLDDQV